MNRKVSHITKDLIRIEEKRKAMTDLKIQQIDVVKKMIRISKYPKPKRSSTVFRRAFKLYAFGVQILLLQEQIKMISWQPIFPQDGLPIVGEEIKIKGTNH